jgi:hypothetical protein
MKLEVGKVYKVKGFDYLCLCEKDGMFFLAMVNDKMRPVSCAYRYDINGRPIDLSMEWTVTE